MCTRPCRTHFERSINRSESGGRIAELQVRLCEHCVELGGIAGRFVSRSEHLEDSARLSAFVLTQ
jgi:hypothetical protein